MAQNLSKTQADTKSPDKKIAKIDAHGHAPHRKPFWSVVSKKLLLPASVLFTLVGLFIAGYNVWQLVTPAETYTLSTGLKVASVIMGALIALSGILGFFVKKGKRLMTLGIISTVFAVIILTATAAMGTVALVGGIVAVVLGLIYIVSVDGMFDTGLIRFFREMIGEVKKLNWLSGKELFSHTLAVVVFVLGMALIIYLLDLAFSSGFGALSTINIG